MLLAVLGCDSKPVVEVKQLPAIEKSGLGVIRGKVTFEGKPPTMAKINNSICHGANEVYEEFAIVASDGGLKNAIVYVDGVRGPLDKTPEPAGLDQVNCQFVPHVVAVRVGQTLRVTNSEAEMHNVHGNPKQNESFNKSFMGKGSQDMTFAKSEIFSVACDVHPWMKGYVGVFDSSYFAVTDNAGRFEITGLPAGTYDLKVWHERYGVQQQSVTIATDPVDAGFVYRPDVKKAN
jgi:plastocyanin